MVHLRIYTIPQKILVHFMMCKYLVALSTDMVFPGDLIYELVFPDGIVDSKMRSSLSADHPEFRLTSCMYLESPEATFGKRNFSQTSCWAKVLLGDLLFVS